MCDKFLVRMFDPPECRINLWELRQLPINLEHGVVDLKYYHEHLRLMFACSLAVLTT